MRAEWNIQKIHNVFDGILLSGRSMAKRRKSDGLVYVFGGTAVYKFDGYSFTAREGCVMLLAKDNSYIIDVAESLKFICVDFDFEPLGTVRRSEVFSSLPASVGNLMTRLLRVWLGKNLWYLPETRSLVFQLCAECVKSSAKGYAKSNSKVSEAIGFITEHYTDPELSVSEVAEHIGVSEVHLRRIFHTAVNTSPVKYINSLRLKKAKDLLRHSNCSIGEAAQLSGFSGAYYFSRFFRQETGVSPKEYRQHGDFADSWVDLP